MRTGIPLTVTSDDRIRLEGVGQKPPCRTETGVVRVHRFAQR